MTRYFVTCTGTPCNGRCNRCGCEVGTAGAHTREVALASLPTTVDIKLFVDGQLVVPFAQKKFSP